MKSCERCGIKFQHNYLVEVFATVKEKRERLIVCHKCREALQPNVSAGSTKK